MGHLMSSNYHVNVSSLLCSDIFNAGLKHRQTDRQGESIKTETVKLQESQQLQRDGMSAGTVKFLVTGY